MPLILREISLIKNLAFCTTSEINSNYLGSKKSEVDQKSTILTNLEQSNG